MSISLSRRFMAQLLTMAFLSASISSRAAGPAVGDSFHEVVQRYMKARDAAYRSKNLETFLDEFRADLSPGALALLKNSLVRGIPALEINSEKLKVFSHANSTPFTVEVLDIKSGDFLLNGRRYRWQEGESFESNVEQIKRSLRSDSLTWRRALNLFFPTAYAGTDHSVSAPYSYDDKSAANLGSEGGMSTTSKVLIGVAVVAVVALVWWLVKKNQNKEKSVKKSKSSDDRTKEYAAKIKEQFEKGDRYAAQNAEALAQNTKQYEWPSGRSKTDPHDCYIASRAYHDHMKFYEKGYAANRDNYACN